MKALSRMDSQQELQAKGEYTYNIDEAIKSFGKAFAVNITAANSYILAFHVDSKWHKYKVYATFRVTTSERISATIPSEE